MPVGTLAACMPGDDALGTASGGGKQKVHGQGGRGSSVYSRPARTCPPRFGLDSTALTHSTVSFVDQQRIRNFCIIAHIDHGKSTLADRMLEATGTLTSREMQDQVLDSMDLERERGITIKSHAIRMNYKARDGETYILNLIDTPGHVDFSYEVSRALNACEGAILVVDAAQGIEAQTIANLYQAINVDLEIIPVLNKIDLPSARPEIVAQTITDLIGGDPDDVLHVSAKTGMGVEDVLEAVVARVPPPDGDPEAPLKSAIFDSVFDQYRGAIAYVRVFDGTLNEGDPILFMATDKRYFAEEIGVLKMGMQKVKTLRAGEVGYVIGSVKDVRDARVGDTITNTKNPASVPVPGFREVKPMVFSGIYPTDSADFEDLRAVARQAATQRRRADLRARDEHGARLRLPRRFPRDAPHGDRAGAARPRVRPRHHHDAPERPLHRRTDERGDDRSLEPERDAEGGRDRGDPRAVTSRRRSSRRPSTSAR